MSSNPTSRLGAGLREKLSWLVRLVFGMSLFIGKNHQGDNSPVQSVFRLAGNDEDALTYALGYLLARDADFCAKLFSK